MTPPDPSRRRESCVLDPPPPPPPPPPPLSPVISPSTSSRVRRRQRSMARRRRMASSSSRRSAARSDRTQWNVFGEGGIVQQPGKFEPNWTSWGHALNASGQPTGNAIQCKVTSFAAKQVHDRQPDELQPAHELGDHAVQGSDKRSHVRAPVLGRVGSSFATSCRATTSPRSARTRCRRSEITRIHGRARAARRGRSRSTRTSSSRTTSAATSACRSLRR